jgi:GMP synthase (glutamine-hydrolysing)
MKIGILQTGHAPAEVVDTLGDYSAMFMRLLSGHGFDFETWSVVDNQFPPGPEAADGWLVTGSKHGAYEDHPWIAPLEALLRDIAASGRPLIGICFGHQIIAQALGGRVEKFSGGWAIGPQEYDFDGTPIALNAWHQDQVVEKPAAARVIATHPFCLNAGLAYGDTVLTVQPHPEFNAEMVDALIRHRGPGLIDDALLDDARDRLETPLDAQSFADRMADFFKRTTS